MSGRRTRRGIEPATTLQVENLRPSLKAAAAGSEFRLALFIGVAAADAGVEVAALGEGGAERLPAASGGTP